MYSGFGTNIRSMLGDLKASLILLRLRHLIPDRRSGDESTCTGVVPDGGDNFDGDCRNRGFDDGHLGHGPTDSVGGGGWIRNFDPGFVVDRAAVDRLDCRAAA